MLLAAMFRAILSAVFATMAALGPAPAPAHNFYHDGWRTSYIANSDRGSVAAQAHGFRWIDNDWHLTRHGTAWGNDHGAPSWFWFRPGDRMENHSAAHVFAMRRTVNGFEYHVRTLREALTDNHAHGLSTEFEVKDVHPWGTPAILDARMAELAQVAAEVYGPDWRRHLVVKVLSDLGGGIPYALKVCRAAHRHGIPTMLLARGPARHMRFLHHPAITYIRGSAVIR